MFKILVLLLGVLSLLLQAQSLKVASVAGYKKPMMQIAKEYKDSRKDVDMMFGNMKKTVSQAKYADVCLVVGDKQYLSTKSELDIKSYSKLGEGKLVLAFAKGVNITSVDDLANVSIKRIAMPHAKKAIYGKAAKEFLSHDKLEAKLKDKLYEVATVPQVATYLISKEVDAGFMNLTAALNHKDKLGGYLIIDTKLYSPIDIVAAELNRENCENISEFVEFLGSDYAKDTLKRAGL